MKRICAIMLFYLHLFKYINTPFTLIILTIYIIVLLC